MKRDSPPFIFHYIDRRFEKLAFYMNRRKTPRRSLNLCSSGKFLEIIVAIVRAVFRKIRRPGLSGTCISGTKLLGSCLEDVAGQRVPCNFVGSRRLSPMGSDIKILCLGGWVLGRATTTLTCLSVSFASFGDNPRQCSVSPLFRLRFRCFPFPFPLFPLLFNIFFFLFSHGSYIYASLVRVREDARDQNERERVNFWSVRRDSKRRSSSVTP